MKVLLFGTLRSVVEGYEELEVAVALPSTVQAVLTQLGAAYPALGHKLPNTPDQLAAGVLVFVNGRSVNFLAGLRTPLREGDRLALFPPIGGG
jgi:sulfur-carrier protein